jgi:hypothetical protein
VIIKLEFGLKKRISSSKKSATVDWFEFRVKINDYILKWKDKNFAHKLIKKIYFCSNDVAQSVKVFDYSGVTRIFRPMGKLLLYREKTMGKIFIDKPNLFWPNKILIT